MQKQRIAIIDDDDQTMAVLDEFLSVRFDVLTESRPDRAISALIEFRPHLVILDIDMPDMSGFEVCEEIRAESVLKDVPIIFLTATTDPKNVHRALKLGANDFLPKPHRPKELLRRIELRLGLVESDGVLSCGNLTLDIDRREVSLAMKRGTQRLSIGTKGAKLLQTLVRNKNTVLSREALISAALGDVEISDRAVDIQIHRLRSQLKRWDWTIRTVYGRGYVVTAKVAKSTR